MTKMLCVQLQSPEIAEDQSSEVICYFTNEYNVSEKKRGESNYIFSAEKISVFTFCDRSRIVGAVLVFALFLGQTTSIHVCSSCALKIIERDLTYKRFPPLIKH